MKKASCSLLSKGHKYRKTGRTSRQLFAKRSQKEKQFSFPSSRGGDAVEGDRGNAGV